MIPFAGRQKQTQLKNTIQTMDKALIMRTNYGVYSSGISSDVNGYVEFWK